MERASLYNILEAKQIKHKHEERKQEEGETQWTSQLCHIPGGNSYSNSAESLRMRALREIVGVVTSTASTGSSQRCKIKQRLVFLFFLESTSDERRAASAWPWSGLCVLDAAFVTNNGSADSRSNLNWKGVQVLSLLTLRRSLDTHTGILNI